MEKKIIKRRMIKKLDFLGLKRVDSRVRALLNPSPVDHYLKPLD